MEGLFARQAFAGFGPYGLAGMPEPPALHVVRGRRQARLRALVRRDGPRLPGVYGMVDDTGELIYVGKAKSLRARLLSYFRPRSRDAKAGRIVACTRSLVWEPSANEFAALLRELELIQRWRPRFNVQGQPARRRRVYMCVGRRPAPYVFLAARPPGTAYSTFGPVPGGAKAREAVRRLNDWYGLRDCPQKQPMVFADQQELFPILRAAGCLRHEIGQCAGPCAAACTRAEYGAHVRAAVAFLEGRDAAPLQTLERDMAAAAAALEFERAAALRDKLDVLRWLTLQLECLRQATPHSFVYPVAGHDGAEWWYLIHRGRVRAAVPAPNDDASRQTAFTLVEAVFAAGGDGPPGPDEVAGVLLVASWFRRHREERARGLDPEAVLATP